MKKISFASLTFVILAFLISSTYATVDLKKGPANILPKKDPPAKKIKPPKESFIKVKTKLHRRGSRLYLKVNPKPHKVELYYGKKRLKAWSQKSKFDITPYLSESRKKFKFVFYDSQGRTQSKDVSVYKYAYLVKKPPQKLKPKKKPEIIKPPVKKSKEPYVHIEKIYLKNNRIHVVLRNTGAGDLSKAEQYRGKIRVRSKSMDAFWTPIKINATMKAFGASGKGVEIDTKQQIKGIETVWVTLENIRGDQRKVAILKPEFRAPNIPPGQRQFTDMDMSLTINGSPFSADIPADGTARIYWNLPPASYVARVYLRIKRGTIAPRDPQCPASGTSSSAGRSLIEGWDSGDLGLPGQGEHGGRFASVNLSPDGRYDLNQYAVGQTYSIVACGQRRTTDGDHIYGLGSNVVTMRLRPAGSLLSGVGLPESPPRPEIEHVLAGRVWIRASGAVPRSGPDDPRIRGGSLVGDGEVFFGYPGFQVLIRKGPLSIHGIIPGTRDEYAYVLVVRPERFPECRNAAHTANVEEFVSAVSGVAVVDRNDIAGDGVISFGTRISTTHVSVPQDSRRNLSYYVGLYVVGTPPPGSGRSGYQAVCSNVVIVTIAHSR